MFGTLGSLANLELFANFDWTKKPTSEKLNHSQLLYKIPFLSRPTYYPLTLEPEKTFLSEKESARKKLHHNN